MEQVAGPSIDQPTKRRRRRNILIQSQTGSSSEVIPLIFQQKKRPKLALTNGEQLMIINIFKYIPKDKYFSIHDLVEKTSEICGVNEKSIYRVLSECKEDSPKISEPKAKICRLNILQRVDNFDKSAIRKIVHRFYLKDELPTLKKIVAAVNDDPDLPTLSMPSLRHILKQLKFKYIKRNRECVIIDRRDIVLWRIKYLAEIKQCREENRRIFYIDETSVSAGHTVDKTWVDSNIKSVKQTFKEGLSTKAREPVSNGKRLSAVHVGNEEGFLENCDWVFESDKAGDYHEIMDASHFEEWFSKVLHKLQPNDVIVLDNARCHSRCVEKTPTMSWRKDLIHNWLQSKNILFDTNEVKRQLMDRVNKIKRNYQQYVIDEMAKQKGVTVLRLPPYHGQLNPIELIWADIKGYVARHNTTFKIADVKKLLEEGMAQVTKDKWAHCVDHVKKEETKMRSLDNAIDKAVDRFIINLCDTSESSNDSEDSSY